MLFNSINFLFFFVAVTAGYFIIPHRWRWLLLLAASCYFYMSFIPVYVLILAFTIAIDYVAGIYIEKSAGAARKRFLILSIIANVGILFFFKYFNFFNQNLSDLANLLHWNYSLTSLSIILPIGLSFHTFQSLSYTIEVYRGHQRAERHFGIFALYVMFYPQLVAGPIERPQNLLHQFYEKHKFELQRIASGLEQMLYGFFKKLVIADGVAVYVNQIYNHTTDYNGLSLSIATVFFAIQIYCDFSGYSDIALGAARVMGFKLMDNFRQPYFSRSISEFWSRWHISLSTWFKDYVYIPLGGNRVSKLRNFVNILITFLLSGIWHGANWTFAVWGLINGLYLIFSRITQGFREKFLAVVHIDSKSPLLAIFQTVATFTLICFTWIFFRARSMGDAFYIIGKIFSDWGNFIANIANIGYINKYVFLNLPRGDFYWCLFGIICLFGIEYFQINTALPEKIDKSKLKYVLKWFLLSTALLLIIILSKSESQQFIYFQF